MKVSDMRINGRRVENESRRDRFEDSRTEALSPRRDNIVRDYGERTVGPRPISPYADSNDIILMNNTIRETKSSPLFRIREAVENMIAVAYDEKSATKMADKIFALEPAKSGEVIEKVFAKDIIPKIVSKLNGGNGKLDIVDKIINELDVLESTIEDTRIFGDLYDKIVKYINKNNIKTIANQSKFNKIVNNMVLESNNKTLSKDISKVSLIDLYNYFKREKGVR